MVLHDGKRATKPFSTKRLRNDLTFCGLKGTALKGGFCLYRKPHFAPSELRGARHARTLKT